MTLIAAMFVDAEVRIPGERRRAIAARSAAEGIEVADAVLAQLG